VEATDLGEQAIENPGEVVHSVEPSEGVTLSGRKGVPTHLDIEVSEPGVYTLVAKLDDVVVDQIDLHFERPSAVELVSHVRAPWGDSFEPMTGDAITVGEGSQVAFQAIPLDGEGERLVGEMGLHFTVTPQWAVTPGFNVTQTHEFFTVDSDGQPDFYFVEPAQVVITAQDPSSRATGSQSFQVTPVERTEVPPPPGTGADGGVSDGSAEDAGASDIGTHEVGS
jgi:hypothetical protein